MTWAIVNREGKTPYMAIVDGPPWDPPTVIALLKLSEDDHGLRLLIEWPNTPKATKIVRISGAGPWTAPASSRSSAPNPRIHGVQGFPARSRSRGDDC